MQNQSNLLTLQSFFFEGALHGWAGGNDHRSVPVTEGVPGMEGWMEISYENQGRFPGYQFFDRWGQNQDTGVPSGHLCITHSGITVWCMYVGGGHYDPDVLPYLRQVLKETYQGELFFGGRGYRELREGRLLYTNQFTGDFSQFSGQEKIEYMDRDGRKTQSGFHHYFGGIMI